MGFILVYFDVFLAGFISLTSVILCNLIGLQKLTNAFGLLTMFRGAAVIAGPPVAGKCWRINYDPSLDSFNCIFVRLDQPLVVSECLGIKLDSLVSSEYLCIK